MISLEIPVLLVKISANLILFWTIYLVWITGVTPSYVALAFFFFNLSGLLFVSAGFNEDITALIKDGAFIVFVSYVLMISFVIDQILTNKNRENKNNGKR